MGSSRRREERKEGYEARVMGQWKKREDGLRARRYILHPVVLLGLAIGSSKSFFENHGIETLDF
jgi:hypothetical protein